MSKRKIGMVALLMAAIVAVSALFTLLAGVSHGDKDRLRVVASFYPVYIASLYLTNGVEGVQVVSLTQPQTGCLHDYQLSPDNLITLEGADALVLNGAGAESFLDNVLSQRPELPVIDTSEGIALLENGHEDHDDHDHDHDHGLYNEHIWTSPARYRQQVENLRAGLCSLDPGHADAYNANAAAYTQAIDQMEERLREAFASLQTTDSVIFHNSLAYLAQDMGLRVAASLPIGEESGVSAADLAAAQEAAKTAGKILLLYDSQYPVSYEYIGNGAAESRTLVLDTAVVGPADKNAWLDAMARNADAVLAAADG